ncbi:anti-sigma factor family protein [Streptomyces sp. YIM S03343]
MHPPTHDCTVVRGLLPEYALNLLSPEESAPVRQHLHVCDTCRTEHDEYARVVAILAVIRDFLPVPPGKDASGLRNSCAQHIPGLTAGAGIPHRPDTGMDSRG